MMRIDDELRAVAEFWSARYRDEGYIWGKDQSPCVQAAIPRFQAAGAKSVLVLGCGYGRDVRYLTRHGFSVTAVDFAPAALDLARAWATEEQWAGATFIRDNIAELAFAGDEFDAVYSHRTLHLLLSPDRFERALFQIARVLKPGGVACLSMRNPDDPSRVGATPLVGGPVELAFRPGHKVLYLSALEARIMFEKHFAIAAFEEMAERESCSKNYEVKLHFAVLNKKKE